MEVTIATRLNRWNIQQRLSSLPAGVRHTLILFALAALLGLGTVVVYLTGGTRYAYPYLMLVPVLLAAPFYGLSGALIAALVAGSLMAMMPMDVATQQPQSTLNWLIRSGLYLFIGGVAGAAFSLLNHAHAASEIIARKDPRTSLPNQVALEEAVWRSLSSRRLRRQRVGLILVRITDIAEVMEALGPEASDALVQAVSDRLLRQSSLITEVFRFSGAELVLLLEAVDPQQIERIASRLAEAGEENLVVQEVPLRVQLAMGSSWQDSLETTPEDLIRQARVALLAAIEKHRSHCHYTEDLARHKLETIKLISKVRRDLEDGQFELHYQPKLRLSDGQVCGCEGLIRWRDDSGAFISPGAFMPKVENTTLITPVTHFVASEACRFAGRIDGVVSINLSVRNLHDETLLNELRTLVERSGIDPHRLEVEITESALMHDLFVAKQALECLRAYGIHISIDDFGTGFSSFEYLQHLPITGLKIDRAFVKDMATDERAQRLMACLIDVGHALELEVTAEGVETMEQHRLLCRLGCDQAQGFLYAKALPEDDYIEWLHNHQPSAWVTEDSLLRL